LTGWTGICIPQGNWKELFSKPLSQSLLAFFPAGMVAWQNTFFFRKEPVEELVNAMQPAQGTHLWFPIGPLLRSPRSIAQRAVQERLPEVVVEGAKEVKILGG